jgi:hypothetical protein
LARIPATWLARWKLRVIRATESLTRIGMGRPILLPLHDALARRREDLHLMAQLAQPGAEVMDVLGHPAGVGVVVG